MDTDKLHGTLTEIKLSIQKIALSQEAQARDIAHHIQRTDDLQDIVEQISEVQRNCPARLDERTNKQIINKIKDLSVILGVIAMALKLWGII